jgi:hypothetical protein
MPDPNDDEYFMEFLGRPADKVRFQNGDLVEILWVRNTVRLGIVGNPPWSPETVKESKKRTNDNLQLDSGDDTYYALLASEKEDENEDEDEEYTIHEHPSPVSMFPVRFPVSDKLRKNLIKQYKIYRRAFE